jgi:YesN/AraC family two-component response regulator
MKILLVDDEPFALRTLNEMIDGAKGCWEIVAAVEDGEEAIAVLQEQEVDLVISDIRMPAVDGLELSKHIEENFSNVKVMLLTGYRDFGYAQQALRYGVVDYILKPSSFESLFESIERIENEVMKEKNLYKLMQKRERDILEKRLDDFEQKYEGKKNGRVIEIVIEKMKCSLEEDLSLKLLAEQVYLNPTYLGRIFKEATGESFSSYLIRLRIEKAKRLLMNPALKIYEVCEQIGYSDPAHFTHVFKKSLGITPQEYKMKS